MDKKAMDTVAASVDFQINDARNQIERLALQLIEHANTVKERMDDFIEAASEGETHGVNFMNLNEVFVLNGKLSEARKRLRSLERVRSAIMETL